MMLYLFTYFFSIGFRFSIFTLNRPILDFDAKQIFSCMESRLQPNVAWKRGCFSFSLDGGKKRNQMEATENTVMDEVMFCQSWFCKACSAMRW